MVIHTYKKKFLKNIKSFYYQFIFYVCMTIPQKIKKILNHFIINFFFIIKKN